MKSITPNNFGERNLNQKNQRPPANANQANRQWQSFRYKETVLNILLEDQYGLCCYSELRADKEGLGYHIEHVLPKSGYPAQTFSYSNLAASALHSDDLQTFIQTETFGGHAKGSQFDTLLFVSCHSPDCAKYFAYLSDGRVVPRDNLTASEKDQARYTINLLNLNSPYLTNRRRRWYDELDQLFAEHITKQWSVGDLAAIDLTPGHEQRLSPFFSLTRQFFGPIAEQVIKQFAPQLA